MERLDKKEVLPTLEGLLEKIEKGGTEVFAYEKDALKQVIEQYETKERPMSAYFTIEDWIYSEGGKGKSIEIKSAMVWGALWVVSKMGCIDWNEMRNMYGEFMSKQMNLR